MAEGRKRAPAALNFTEPPSASRSQWYAGRLPPPPQEILHQEDKNFVSVCVCTDTNTHKSHTGVFQVSECNRSGACAVSILTRVVGIGWF